MSLWLIGLLLLPSNVDVLSITGNQQKRSSACSYVTDNFSLWWMYDKISNDVIFKMVSRSTLKNYWSGFFVGDKQPIDALGVIVRGERISLMDGHVLSNRSIEMDDNKDVQYLMLESQNHVLTAEFIRPLTTIDSFDVDLSDCTTFFIPTNSIKMNGNGQLMVPQRMSRRRVCDLTKLCSNREHHQSFKKRSDPTVCEYKSGVNTVRWNSIGGSVEFFVEQNVKQGKWWSAVGVGESMKNMKAAIAFMENGNVKSIGGYQTQGYETPKTDSIIKPALNTANTKINNGRSLVSFTIPKNVIDLYTNGTGCVTLQIAILAGEWTGRYEVKKHSKTPDAVTVCGIKQCSNKKIAFVEDSTPTVVVRAKALKRNAFEATTMTYVPQSVSDVAMHSSNHVTLSSMNMMSVDDGSGEGSGEYKENEEEEEEEEEEGSGEHEPQFEITEAMVPRRMKVIGEAQVPVTAAPIHPTTTKVKASTVIIERPGVPLVISKTLTDEVRKIIHQGCDKHHKDSYICETYFNNYLYDVAEWAKKHHLILEEHLWKACMLLSLVERVPTQCCTKFQNTCNAFLDFMRARI